MVTIWSRTFEGKNSIIVVNWGDLMVQDFWGGNYIMTVWVTVPFVNIFKEYYSPLVLLYIYFMSGQCAFAAFVNIFELSKFMISK